MKIAVVRGAFLGQWEMQNFLPLKNKKTQVVAFGAKHTLTDIYGLPLVRLWSPVDLPSFPKKMAILNRILGDAHYLRGLESRLRGFDIAHCAETYYYYTQQCLRAKAQGRVTRVISTVWETIPFNNEGVWRRKAFKQNAYRNVDLFITPTNRGAKALAKEGVAEDRIKTIPMGVDLKSFFPQTEKRREGKQIIDLLFVGRLVAEKGIWELLEVFRELKKDKLPIRLTLIGQGREKQRIMKWLRSYGLVNFVKIKLVKYKQMPNVYRRADIFLLLSKRTHYWEEQYGMAAVEAMASGLPVVVGSSGALPEVVGPAGIVVSGKKEQLYRRLKQLIVNKKQRYWWARKARRRVGKYFNAQETASKLRELYRSVLAEN